MRPAGWPAGDQPADQALLCKQTLLHTHHLRHNAAAVFAMCGKPGKAMPLLERCAQMGLPNYLLFSRDPHFRALHNRPEFLEFMALLRKEHKQYSEGSARRVSDMSRNSGV